MIQLHHSNTFFVVLCKTTNRQLKSRLWQLFDHCYHGILTSIIIVPMVLPYVSYPTLRITVEFSHSHSNYYIPFYCVILYVPPLSHQHSMNELPILVCTEKLEN